MLGLRERMEENGSAPGTGEAKRSAAAPADPEVVDRPLRRRFSPSYKLRIVEEADRCTEPGEVGQLLRREGLYSSHLTTWRKAAHSGSLKALSKKRGRKPERNPLDEKVRKLERRNARLENELQDIIAREMSLFNRDSAVRVLKQAYDRAVAAEQADV